MTLLDYASPRSPEPRGTSLTVLRYIAGLAAGIVIACVIERQLGGLICCGAYSLLPIGVFQFVIVLRRAYSRIPLEERHPLITIFSGLASALIEYGIGRWADNISSDRLLTAGMAAWVIMPIVCAFVSVRRRALLA